MKNMTNAVSRRAILRSHGQSIVTAAIALTVLSSCTSSNISEFSDGLETQAKSKPQVQREQYAVANLPKGVVDATHVAQLTYETTSYLGKNLQPTPVSILNNQPEPIADRFEQASLGRSIQDQALTPEGIRASQTASRVSKLFAEIDHGNCKGGWGKQAKKLDALRYNPGDPYYIEIRMRHTPPLPVGHTYTAYGRLDENGKKLDENLVMLAPQGGYAGAAVAGIVPMPGKMKPTRADCIMTPTAAYRVSLSAEQYANLLAEIKKAKAEKPRYGLWTQNCNHMTSRLSESVGIKTPRNKYTASVVYMYDIMRENEGSNYKPSRGFRQQLASSKNASKT